MKKLIKRLLKIPQIPNGHYYSPVIDIKEIQKVDLWKNRLDPSTQGIDLNIAEQLALAAELQPYFDTPFPETKGETRYYFNNAMFVYTDAIILYSFLRHFKPRKVIEVGSGYTSALMLDTKDLYLTDLELMFIEPYPERLQGLMKPDDTAKVIISNLQDVPLENFDMEPNDILFIDSSHVTKAGSDVNYLVFEILPRLKAGVIIHIHDIFYPFEYPREWIMEGRSWNEAYLIRAFLMYNSSFKIKFFNSYLHLFHKDVFSTQPLFYKNSGGSLWMQKV